MSLLSTQSKRDKVVMERALDFESKDLGLTLGKLLHSLNFSFFLCKTEIILDLIGMWWESNQLAKVRATHPLSLIPAFTRFTFDRSVKKHATLNGILAFSHSLIDGVFSFLVAYKIMVCLQIPDIFGLMRYGGWCPLPPCRAMYESSRFSFCYKVSLP